MRKTINILWLDDNKQKNCGALQNNMSDVLKAKGYSANFITAATVDKATSYLNDKKERIDFFVSDFNLGGESNSNGIDFLEIVRNNNITKQFFILYSHTSKKSLRESLISKIKKEPKSIDSLIVNFDYFSIGDDFRSNLIRAEFSRIVDIALCRWEELSALRGEYASINTLADSILEKVISALHVTIRKANYFKRINKIKDLTLNHNLFSSFSTADLEVVFGKWHECREIRNSLEHNPENWDSILGDYYILNTKDGSKIFESKASDNRKRLLDEVAYIKKFLVNLVENNSQLSFLLTDSDYNNFISA